MNTLPECGAASCADCGEYHANPATHICPQRDTTQTPPPSLARRVPPPTRGLLIRDHGEPSVVWRVTRAERGRIHAVCVERLLPASWDFHGWQVAWERGWLRLAVTT